MYDTHHRRALGLACRMLGDQAEAEDVVQEAFLACSRTARLYDTDRGTTGAWLLATVRNRSIDVLRKRRRQPVGPLDPSLQIPDGRDPIGEAITRLDGEIVRRALAELPPEQRQAIELAYFGGLSHTEIAAHLGTPVGTVKGRLRLALNRLRLALVVDRSGLVPLPAVITHRVIDDIAG